MKVYMICLIYKIMFMFGMMKLFSVKSMILVLISVEILSFSSFLLFISSWWVSTNINSVSFFLVLVVIEGVIGLLILSSLFRKSSVSSSSSLYF